MELSGMLLSCYGSASSNDRERIAYDINNLIFAVPTLGDAGVEEFVGNDGEARSLIRLSGTLPIDYKRNQYNIPLKVWISKGYPRFPPLVYVTPTSDMMIKPSHRHVDTEGLVYHPYLNAWDPAHSSLHELAHKLQIVFSEDPPVFAKVHQNQPPPKYADGGQPPPAYSNVNVNGSSAQIGTTGTTGNIMTTAATHVNLIASGSRPAFENEADKRRKVTRKIQSRMESFLRDVRVDLEKEYRIQDNLEKSSNLIETNRKQLIAQLTKVNESIISIQQRKEELTQWLADNSELGNGNGVHIENDIAMNDFVVPADDYSNQLFDVVAESNAIEDTLFELDEAITQGVIDLRTFLREVRNLSRRLLFTTALGLKIMEQQNALAPSIPPRQFAVPSASGISYPRVP